VLRDVVRLRKYRCVGCRRTRWAWNGFGVWRQLQHVRKDPVARRVYAQRWRRAALVALFALISALVFGQAVGRWHESMSMVEPVP
jgi:hypothetical protein